MAGEVFDKMRASNGHTIVRPVLRKLLDRPARPEAIGMRVLSRPRVPAGDWLVEIGCRKK